MNLSPMLTDLYQFTMFESYVHMGVHRRPATFDLFFRQVPDYGAFAIACGLETALSFLEGFRFKDSDLDYLKRENILSSKALQIAKSMRFEGEILTVPEGTPVLPGLPMFRVTGPLGVLQLIESPLLNLVNFETLIATKASRIVRCAAPATVTEFGLRRAHGPHAAIYGARASFVAGAVATSNVEAARRFGIPPKGTMAHSYVMSFVDELSAFRAFVKRYPIGATLLVDTFDTIRSGVPHAIEVGLELEKSGGKLGGIRLDSGDLASLSWKARKMLDKAGLPDVKIFASNDLDEFQILEFRRQKAPIDAYGVGTRLVTAYSDAALGGIYKLVAVFEEDIWIPKIKTTSDFKKATIPGRKMVYRVFDEQGMIRADILGVEGEDVSVQNELPFLDRKGRMHLDPNWQRVPLLHKVWDGTQRLYRRNELHRVQTYCKDQLSRLPEAALDISDPIPVPCALSRQASALRNHCLKAGA